MRYAKITDRCESCYGFHATDAEWNACWADEDAYSAELDGDSATILVGSGPCSNCQKPIEVYQNKTGDYRVTVDAGVDAEHECA